MPCFASRCMNINSVCHLHLSLSRVCDFVERTFCASFSVSSVEKIFQSIDKQFTVVMSFSFTEWDGMLTPQKVKLFPPSCLAKHGPEGMLQLESFRTHLYHVLAMCHVPFVVGYEQIFFHTISQLHECLR